MNMNITKAYILIICEHDRSKITYLTNSIPYKCDYTLYNRKSAYIQKPKFNAINSSISCSYECFTIAIYRLNILIKTSDWTKCICILMTSVYEPHDIDCFICEFSAIHIHSNIVKPFTFLH